jgi:hypothetical protein
VVMGAMDQHHRAGQQKHRRDRKHAAQSEQDELEGQASVDKPRKGQAVFSTAGTIPDQITIIPIVDRNTTPERLQRSNLLLSVTK